MLNEAICNQKIKLVVDKGEDRTKSIIAWLSRIETSGCTITEFISDRIRLLSFYIESNIATISNDVGLCFRFGQISNGSKFVRFSMKDLGGKAFFKMHFAKS